jgi:hypothetical protein
MLTAGALSVGLGAPFFACTMSTKMKRIIWGVLSTFLAASATAMIESSCTKMQRIIWAMEAQEMGPDLREVRIQQLEAVVDSLKAYHD